MTTRIIRRIAALTTLPILFSGVSIAQGEDLPQGTLTIDQANQFQMLSPWTIINAIDQKSYSGGKAHDQIELPPGNYTFFISQPKGMVPLVTLSDGTKDLQSVEVPQLTFASDGSPLKITVTFQIKESGKVGVNSDPKGIPFDLQGPSNFVLQGVTPQAYETLPLGQYSVRYLPKGCSQPPQKSGSLTRDSRIDFMISIKCDALQPVLDKETQNQDFVSVMIDDQSVAFLDVLKTQWYATYVESVARRGIITGYRGSNGKPLGIFGPDKPVTLAELAKIAHEVAGINEATRDSTNPTVPTWAEHYVASAEMRDWVVFEDPRLDVKRPATRGEVAVTLLQALNVPLLWPTGNVFKDVSRKTLYAGAIETLAAKGIVSGSAATNGSSTGLFGPITAVNRAELAKILMKFMDTYKPSSGTGSVVR